MTFQLDLLKNHQENIAERVIQTFKGHFISILCGTGTNFPFQRWFHLLTQTKLTLSFLQSAR